MPVVVIHGAKEGPTAWISGAIHGDELNGVEIVRQMIQRISATEVAGTVLAVPVVNVFGLANGSRYLPDRRDLNRCFPGSAKGSLAARLARIFYDEIACQSTVGIDFHTGSNGRYNYPQIRCNMDEAGTRKLAEVFGAPALYHANLRDGSLRAAAAAHGVKALLFEGGEAHRFDEDVIRIGVAGGERVLHDVGILSSSPERSSVSPVYVRSSKWIRAGRSGFAHVHVAMGQLVEQGEKIASVTDTTSGKEFFIRSRVAGVVIGALRSALIHRGDGLVHVGELAKEDGAP